MLRILRAFAWLRVRMLINSLEKTSARDTLERFSLAMEKLGPIMAAVLMIPSALALAVLGVAGGFGLGREGHSMLFEAARYMLVFVPLLSIVGPLFLPAADRTNPVRMLLLPIPRSTLYVAQSATAFGDVWTMLMLPVVAFVPIGLAAAGALWPAAIAIAGGLLLVLVVVGLSSLATSLLHLIVRDRRRGELVALIFILLIPALSMLPGLLQAGRHRRGERRAPARQEFRMPSWAVAAGERAVTLYPSELYVQSTRRAAAGYVSPAVTRLAALGATAVVIHLAGMFVFARVLDSPGTTGGRRSVTAREAWGRTLPGLTPGASAVALAHLRLALRTPRGRSIVLSPLVMMGVFAFVMRQRTGLDLGPIGANGGVSLASFAAFVCFVATLPIVVNQFAVDRAGMTLALLSPLSDAEYLIGKAVGNALIAFPPALICVAVAIAVFQDGSLAAWTAIPLALLATFLLVSGPSAILSALFPRLVDLNSIGRGSNAHGLASLLGMLLFVAAGASNLAIVFAARSWLDASFVPVLLLAWCAVAFIVSRFIFIAARRIFASRRENLALLLNDR